MAVELATGDCIVCGSPELRHGSRKFDHIVGIEEGGDCWARRNLQALCLRCHLIKSQREYRDRWVS